MTAFLRRLFVVLAFVSIFQGARAQCSLSNITVQQTNTGATVNGKPEFEVEVINDCICTEVNVQLSCKGFDSIEPVDPSIFRPIGGDRCLVNDGAAVYYDSAVKFKYAQDEQIDIAPVYSDIACS